ncbi:hypothetical protein [Salisediminibacterium halotolerans]|uniref:hypothetical protein n=1 Tax=Salisediminibacterium halotolerans TaxID=517425 RepID=UPI000EB0F730|nr:hypothetical protein [Salisediminibacterium halotolerans]GEL08958.1 hypothetical protein SHA02_23740 [Salisediminibacterium halotolerans]
MKRISLTVTGLLFAALLAFVITNIAEEQGAAPESDIKELVHAFSTGAETAEAAAISSHELTVEGGEQGDVQYDLSKEEFLSR